VLLKKKINTTAIHNIANLISQITDPKNGLMSEHKTGDGISDVFKDILHKIKPHPGDCQGIRNY
jgi:hypothetical protein